MPYLLLADAVLLLHLLFILFVLFGAALVWRYRRLVWLHLPAVIWGAWVELSGAACPLTPLETRFRTLGGEAGYSGGFIEHHLTRWIYPAGLTPDLQTWLGMAVVAVNLVLYGFVLRSATASGRSRSG